VELQTSIDELRLNLPKKVLEQMEKQKELNDEAAAEEGKKKNRRSGGKGSCHVS
jgi:hypothetical protein